MIGYYSQIPYSGYWPLDDEWPPPIIGVLPLWRNPVTGEKQEIAFPYVIDASILPTTGETGGGDDFFSFFIGS